MVDGTAIALPSVQAQTPAAASTPAITAGGQTLPILPGPSPGAVIIAGQILQPGSTITISGTPIALPPANNAASIIVGGSIVAIPKPTLGVPSSPPLVIAGQTITPDALGNIIIGTQTLSPNGPGITISGTPISLLPAVGTSQPSIVVNGQTIALPTATSPQQTQLITVGDKTLTLNAEGNIVVGPQTLSPDNSVITISGMPISLLPAVGTTPPAVVIDGKTIPIPAVAGAQQLQPQTIFIGSKTLTLTPDPSNTGNFVIGSQTLTPTTTNGAVELVIDDKTVTVSLPTITAPPGASKTSTLVLSPGTTLTANSQGAFVLPDGQTLSAGGVVTVGSSTITLAAGKSTVGLVKPTGTSASGGDGEEVWKVLTSLLVQKTSHESRSSRSSSTGGSKSGTKAAKTTKARETRTGRSRGSAANTSFLSMVTGKSNDAPPVSGATRMRRGRGMKRMGGWSCGGLWVGFVVGVVRWV
jgi:hypothetical protein